jgi:beta-lactamase superfamily II metal-dependent hydrolase
MSRPKRGRLAITALVAALACALAYFAHAFPRPNREVHRRRRVRAPVPSMPAPTPVAPLAASTRLRITFLGIGQGDAALLETGDGHASMIDTGPPEGIAALRSALASHGIRRLDWLMLSHPHLDHIGGAQAVLDEVQVARVIDPAFPHPIATYEHLLDRIRQLGITFTRGERGGSVDLGRDVHLEIFEPHDPFLANSRSDVNANSLVVRLHTGSVRVLFAGDAERETESRLLADQPDVRAEVLKVAHHGSRYASGAAFLDAVAPRYAVISCGVGNDYGHPHEQTLQALAARHIEVHRTDLEGDVTMTTDGSAVVVQAARGGRSEQGVGE